MALSKRPLTAEDKTFFIWMVTNISLNYVHPSNDNMGFDIIAAPKWDFKCNHHK